MQNRFNYKRLVTITLVFLMTFTCLIEPIGLLAIEDTEAKESENQNDSYLLMKTTSEININDEIIINPDTYLYGTESNEAEYEFVYNDQQITVTKNEVEIISEGENLEIASFIENVESDVEELQDFAASKQFYRLTEYETYETIILLKDTTLPVYKDADAKSFIVIGNTKFYVEEPEAIEDTSETESSEEIAEDPIQEEESSKEVIEEPIQEEENLSENELSSEVVEKTEEENSTENIMVQSEAAQLKVVDVWANTTAKYFEVIKDNVVVYDNRTGSLVKAGELKKDQVYVIVSDYGDWHRIQLGGYYGYVLKSNTIPASDTAIKNENINYKNQDRVFITQQKVPVYDNSSGSLIEFGEIDAGREYAIASDYGSNWWRVIYGGRVGYVSKSNVRVQTKVSDKYFEVAEEDLTVYDKDSGKLVKVGELEKGQVYPRLSDYGNWHKIQFGDSYGYVYKAGTEYTTKEIKNENTSYQNISRTFRTNVKTAVYDNSSGGLVRFGEIESGVRYTIVSEYGDWWRIIYAGRVGYVSKENVSTGFSVYDKYFQVKETDLEVYENRSGKLVSVGELESGQVYPRVSDYGDWHKIQFGDSYGYVYKAGTEVRLNSNLSNENKSYKNSKEKFKANGDLVVYDNSKGHLIAFSKIKSGQTYAIAGNYGDWYRVLVAGRIGYVKKSNVIGIFGKQTKYFEAQQDIDIFDNRGTSLVKIGEIKKGQSYQRLSDYGDWHKIQFGDFYGYVYKKYTLPSFSNSYNNKVSTKYSIGMFTTNKISQVYDNTNQKLVPFLTIEKNQQIPIINDYGDWWEVNLSGRSGYIRKQNGNSNVMNALNLVNPNQEYTYEEMQQDIKELTINYPGLIKSESIGKSVDGRNLYAVKLGNGNTEIFLNGAHHAREWLTTNLLMEMLDSYSQAYANDQTIDGYNVRDLLNKVSIWFVPMVNPDGVTLVQKGAYSTSNPKKVIQMNGGSTNFSRWKANVNGVDLNRQYPAGWSTIENNNILPSYMNHKGLTPLSEPESRAIYNFTRDHDFKTAVAYHSSGQILYWDYKLQSNSQLKYTSRNLANMISSKTGYSLFFPGLNPSGGGFTDWFIESQKKPAFTPEISKSVGERPVPISSFNSIWNENYSIGLMLAKEAYQNRNNR